jgi:predicted 3-demethylubiquinone-9 3-methyltransferase (glyoxalase superfamily)
MKHRKQQIFIARYLKTQKIINSDPMVTHFEINGVKFMGLNGGPEFTFNEAVSFVIECDTQEEIDYYWQQLTANGGQEGNCGWLKDKYGVSWQVVPVILAKLLSDSKKVQRLMKMFRTIKKFDINDLLNA